MSSFLSVTVDIREFRTEQSIGLFANLVRSPVVHTQGLRSAANVHAERLPGERLLEDALAEVAGKEESVGPSTGERREEAQLRDADVLRFDDDPSWLNGLPYAIEELVFDENELMGCFRSEAELRSDGEDN